MGSGADSTSGGRPSSSAASVECSWCGRITGYKAVPGSEQEHRGYLDCIKALQFRLDGSLTGLATAASKERATRTLELKKLAEEGRS